MKSEAASKQEPQPQLSQPRSAPDFPPMAARRKTGRIVILLTLILLLLLYPTGREHLRAISLLARMSHQQNWIARLDRYSYFVQPITFSSHERPIRAKLYTPANVQHPPALVVVPGLHWRGIEEPRLVNFAECMAETGVEVVTPQIDALADYHVEPQSIDIIGRSAQELARRAQMKQVGVLGLSFAGGLALMAASDARYADQISFVAPVGPQDDVERVEHYLVEGHTLWPDGRILSTPPNQYGWLILIYSHPEDFFSAADAEGARTSLRLLLHEDGQGAKREADRLSPEGRALMTMIFAQQREAFRTRLLAHLQKHSAEALAVSPHGHLHGLRAKVLLVHGEGDDVIPPSETQWLAQDIPKGHLQATLISPAISHVNLSHGPRWTDQIRVIHWMALLLGDADGEQRR